MANLNLWQGCVEGEFQPYMEMHLLDKQKRGAVLVCPGGGYGGRADHEAGVIAKRFNELGFHAFVVHYRVAPSQHPAPLKDITRALRIVRKNANEWNVKADNIAVCGFSAGGHLTASIGVHYDDEDTKNSDDLDGISARPDALVLCYPVITSGEFSHQGSFDNLLGKDAGVDMLEKMSLETQVTADTPPAFVWHTANDAAVPVENCLLFAAALSRNNVPFEIHVFPDGRHGLGLAEDVPSVSTWSGLCGTWLRELWQ